MQNPESNQIYFVFYRSGSGDICVRNCGKAELTDLLDKWETGNTQVYWSTILNANLTDYLGENEVLVIEGHIVTPKLKRKIVQYDFE